jgi:UDP-glucuronate 4-epimerase
MYVFVTGAAGFIGFHLCEKLLNEGYTVLGFDNINDYYEVQLKYDRLKELGIEQSDAKVFGQTCKSSIHPNFEFVRGHLEDDQLLDELFKSKKFDLVCNLAAQAGVRYSLENPKAYVQSNLVGFINILECCRHFKTKRLVYASSSSVYGNSEKVPFEETDNVDKPISLYAATKKSNELMAHTYKHLYNLDTVGLRFFTVYGPWGRPDMAPMLFSNAITSHKPIKVFNHGNLSRDFTYIDDIVNGIFATLMNEVENKHDVYNIGNGNPVNLLEFINTIESELGITSEKIMMGMQPGDVYKTWASTEKLAQDYSYKSSTSLREGIKEFVNWYKKYYGKS